MPLSSRLRSASANRTVARAVAGAFEPLETRTLFCGVEFDAVAHAAVAGAGTSAVHASSGAVTRAANSLGISATAHDDAHGLGTYTGANDADAIASTVAANAASGALAAGVPLTGITSLSSRPGATAKLYLNFTGAAAQQWGSYAVPATPAYDQDGDPTTFNTAELTSINEIWQRVSEKYSPFNIDVTTVNPGNLNNLQTIQAVVGGDGAWLGSAAGGVAYVDAFSNSAPNTVWVFPKNLSNGYAKYVAEGVAHESGHGFGLQHQSQYSGTTKTAEYFPGTAAAAPIMGNSYSATRGLWWNGQTTTSTTYQDDVSVIAKAGNGFGYRPDDHSSVVTSATALTLNGTSVSGAGVIEKTTDADFFSFQTGAGAVSLNVSPVLGGMLDAKVQLFDASNNLVTTVDAGLAETLSTTLTAGTYKLAVLSHGAYGDVGQYTISGTVQPSAQVVTVAAPSGLTASAASSSQVNLAWTDNSNNETGFAIDRSTDGTNWTQAGTVGAGVTSYAVTGLAASTAYSFRVRAYAGTTYSGYSNTASATTASALSVPAGPTGLVAAAASSSQIDLAWTDNSSNETGYKVQQYNGSSWTVIANLGANTTGYAVTGLLASTGYGFRVVANNAAGDSAYAEAWATTYAAVTVPAAPSALVGTTKPGSTTLTWTDNSSNETGFTIDRSVDGSVWTQVGTVGANVTTYTDNTVTPGAGYAYRVTAYNSAGGASTGAAWLTVPAYSVIVDNNTAGAITGTGSWYRTTANGGYYGSDYFHDGNANKGADSVIFTPTLANTGTYRVYMRWSAAANRASNTPIDIAYNGGTSTVYADQRYNGGQWVLLGTFNFNAGKAGAVRVRNTGTTGYVVADAVQFVQATAAPSTTPSVSNKVKLAKGASFVAALNQAPAMSTTVTNPAPVFSAQLLSSGGQPGGTADDLVDGKKKVTRPSAFQALAAIHG